jgi:hypothetical protein
MTNQHLVNPNITEADLSRFRRQADAIVQTRRADLARLDAARMQARDAGLPAVEDFFLQIQQADQRTIEQAEQLFGAMKTREEGEPPGDQLVDLESEESFPASDPPSRSRIT